MEEIDLQDIDRTIIHLIQEDISDAEDYQDAVIFPAVTERYEIYYADKNYYARKFPKLSKVSNLVSTDVTDTIEWALPSLMKVFTGSDSVVSVTGVLEEDARNAEVMQELMEYQLSRQNNFFPLLYNWMKDALITGLGIVKCYWDRQEKYNPVTVLINSRALEQLTQAGVEIQNVQGPDEFGDFTVTYLAPYYTKNSPKIENILISEFLYSSDAKNLEEANFVAHKKKVTMSYLRQKEKQGVYSNVDDIKVKNNVNFLNNNNIVEQAIGDQYNQFHQSSDDARDEVYIYECYTKIDINADGILEDMIITTCEDTILRVEENYMGRHPFFSISPTKDPHRIWVKRSYAELIGELQDLKVALMRQLMQNIALTNDPKMILSEDAININDYIEGRAVIRKKAGHQMGDVAMAMPVNQMHPWTFQFLEYIEGQKENRTGITRYNQGLDAQSLNKTATGISAILGQSSQRLELIARMFAETGVRDLFKFMVSLNQKFVDQNTVIRITNKELQITPDDLQGDFDLIVNSGISITTKESTLMTLQTLLTALMQASASGAAITTPGNIYNLFKKWIETAGFKNYTDFITDPVVLQQKAMIDAQMVQQVLMSLPPEAFTYYTQNGTLPPEFLLRLPPQIQALFGSALPQQVLQQGTPPAVIASQQQTQQGGVGNGRQGTQAAAGTPSGNAGGGVSQDGNQSSPQVAGQLQRHDNRTPDNVPRGGNGEPQEQARGIGGF